MIKNKKLNYNLYKVNLKTTSQLHSNILDMQLIFKRKIIRFPISDKKVYKLNQESVLRSLHCDHNYFDLSYESQGKNELNISNTKLYPVSSWTSYQQKIIFNIRKNINISQKEVEKGQLKLGFQKKTKNISLLSRQQIKNRIQIRLVQLSKFYASYYRQPREQKKQAQTNVSKQKQKQKSKLRLKEQKIDQTKNQSLNIVSNDNSKYQNKDSNLIEIRRKKTENFQGDFVINFKDANIKIQERIFNFIDYLVRKIGSQFYNYELYNYSDFAPTKDNTQFQSPSNETQKQHLKKIRLAKFQQQIVHLSLLLQSEQFKKIVLEKATNQQKLQFYYKIIIKIKNEAINQYNIDFYPIMTKVCQIFYQKLSIKENYLNSLVKKLAQNHKIQLMQLSDLKGQKNENKDENLTQQERLQQQKQYQEQRRKKQQISFVKKLNKLSILQQSILIIHMNQIPKQYHNTLINMLIQNVELFHQTTLGVFLADTIVQKRNIQKQKLIQLYKKIEEVNFQFSLRYTYLLFIKYNMEQKLMPLYQIIGKVNRYDIQNYTIEQLYKYVKLISLQIQINKNSLFSQFPIITRKLISIDRIIYENRYSISFNFAIRMYNLLAKQYPIGLLFVSYYKQFLKLNKPYIPEYKKFILFQMVNLNTKFIYSIGERSISQINTNVMNIMDTIIKFIITNDKKFLLQVSKFYQKYENVHQKKNWTEAIQIIIKQLKFNEKSLKFLFCNNIQQKGAKEQSKVLLKLMNFIYKNFNNINLLKIKDFIYEIYSQLLNLQTLTQKQSLKQNEIEQNFINIHKITQQSWRFLFQLTFILNKIQKNQKLISQNIKNQAQIWNINQSRDKNQRNVQKVEKFQQMIIKIVLKFVYPYIKAQKRENQRKMLNKSKKYEQYVLRIVNILEKQNYNKILRKEQFAKQIIMFINNSFIYSVKSVVKRGIFQILALFEVLASIINKSKEYQINPQIYAYLYGNLSTFIVYIERMKKLYITRGKNYQYDFQYEKILINSISNYQILKKIENKDKLNVLSILLQLFWKKMKPKSIAQYLIIISDPILIDGKLKKKIQNVVFSYDDIKQLDFRILSKYKLINESLRDLFNNYAAQSGDHRFIIQNYKLSNSRTSQELKILFQLNQFFEIAIQNKQFTNQHLIPEPSANSDNRTKMIYACLKIISKIRKERDFSINALLQQKVVQNKFRSSSKRYNPINLSQEIEYIQKQNLIKLHDINQFKLDNIEASGHNQMIQCWNYHQQSDKLIQISNFSTFNIRDINPYEKILLVVKGSKNTFIIDTGLIKKLVKRQSIRPDILEVLSEMGVQAFNKGSLIQIQTRKRKIKNQSDTDNQNQFQNQNEESVDSQKKKQIYLLCSNNTNYKIHLIYAYVLSQVGYKVCQVDETDSIQSIKKLILKQLEKSQQKQDENIQLNSLQNQR